MAAKDILNTPAQISGGKIQGMPYLHMDGPAVFKFAVKALSDIAAKTLAEASATRAKWTGWCRIRPICASSNPPPSIWGR